MHHLGRMERWFRTPVDHPVQHLRSGRCFCIPGQTFARVRHTAAPQATKKVPIVRELGENPLYLGDDVGLTGHWHFVTDISLDDVSRPAEVDDHRYGAAGQSLENHAPAVL